MSDTEEKSNDQQQVRNESSQKKEIQPDEYTGCHVSIEVDSDAEDNLACASAVFKPEPPDLPQFVNHLRVEQISPEIQRLLRLTLDLSSPGSALKNWEWLAHQLGLPPQEITYIRERAQYPNSPTIVLLRQYGRENLGRILRLIRDDLQRYDVIIQILPALHALEEHLKLSERSNAPAAAASEPKKGEDSPPLDSGFVQQSTVEQHTSPENSVSIAAAASTSATTPRASDGHVLLTYADDGPQHTKFVLWLCKNLEGASVTVFRDDTIAAHASDDWAGRVSEYFSKARAIVVVCSPKYYRCVEASNVDVSSDLHCQCSRLIYQLMCAEYRQQNCRNRRFRPVIFDTYDASVVPSILRNTIVHRWPKQHKEFMKFICGEHDGL